MKTLTEKRFFEWHEDDISVTLRNNGGSYGGGSEVLIIESTSQADALEHYAERIINGFSSNKLCKES